MESRGLLAALGMGGGQGGGSGGLLKSMAPAIQQFGIGLLSQPDWATGLGAGAQAFVNQREEDRRREAIMDAIKGATGAPQPASRGLLASATPGINPDAESGGLLNSPAAAHRTLSQTGGAPPNPTRPHQTSGGGRSGMLNEQQAGLLAAMVEAGQGDAVVSALVAKMLDGPAKRQTARDANGYLRDIQSGQRVFGDVVREADPTTAQRDFAFALENPGFDEWRRANAKAGASQVNVGGSTIRIGPEDLAGKTKGGLETEVLEADATLARLDEIGASFDPRFLEIPFRAKMEGAKLAEKAGIDIGAEMRADLEGFAEFKRAAIANINRHIKAITGATATEEEVPRLMAEMPSAGTGIFDGDNPSDFKGKYDSKIRELKLVRARAMYARANGLVWKDIDLDTLPTLIDRRGDTLAEQLRTANPALTPEEVTQHVQMRLKQEFGL